MKPRCPWPHLCQNCKGEREVEAERLLQEVERWFAAWCPGDLGEYPACLPEIKAWLDAVAGDRAKG